MKQYKLVKTYPNSPELGTVKPDNWDTAVELDYNIGSYPEHWQLVEKDYEILSFKGIKAKDIDEDGAYLWDNEMQEWFPTKDDLSYILEGYSIKSVKRLSDGVVFNVGDIVKHKNYKSASPIIAFKIWDNKTLSVHKKHEETISDNHLESILHADNPLFKTHDGVDIYHGDKYWYVDAKTWNIVEHVADQDKYWGHLCYFKNGIFSTKELAEEYVLKNKPTLSYNDLENWSFRLSNGYIGSNELMVKLLELIKSKNK